MTPNEIAAVRERLISINTRDLEIAETYQMQRMLTNVRTNGNAKDIQDALAALDALAEQNATIAARVKAMVEWLEREQPDVFRRGIWDAINEAAP